MKIRLILGVLFIASAITTSVQAKRATYSDVMFTVSHQEETHVKSDGGYSQKIKRHIEVLKQPKGYLQATYFSSIPYAKDLQEVKIAEARIIFKNGTEFVAKESNIIDLLDCEDPENSNFGHQRKRTMIFPKITAGDKIILEYEITSKSILFKGHFEWVTEVDPQVYFERYDINIHSELPLYLTINDSNKVFEVEQNTNDKTYEIKIELNKPLNNCTMDEQQNSISSTPDNLTWIVVTTFKNWEDYAKLEHENFSKVLSKPLPELFQTIQNKALEEKDEIAQINAATTAISEKIKYKQYFDDYRDGSVPKALGVIADKQQADCKGFGVVTAATLNGMGYKAQIALVCRGVKDFTSPPIPDLGMNHVIVKVTDKNNRVYWLDTTNHVSMADGIFPDIAGKMTLVLDAQNPSYEQIPNIIPEHAKTTMEKQLQITNGYDIIENGKLVRNKEEIVEMKTHVILNNPPIETIKDGFYDSLARGDSIEKINMDISEDLSSPIVKDIIVNYTLKRKRVVLKTNNGLALKLSPPESLDPLYKASPENILDLIINVDGVPLYLEQQTIIKNAYAINPELSKAEINTPWLYAKREVFNTEDSDIQIFEKFITPKNIILNSELKNPDFAKMQEKLYQACR